MSKPKKAAFSLPLETSYQEAGAMMRHYSITRTSIVTLSYTLAFGISAYSFNYRDETNTVIFLIFLEIFLMLMAIYASCKISSIITIARKLLIDIETGKHVRVNSVISQTWITGELSLDDFDKISVIAFLVFNAALILAHFYFV